MKTALRLLFAFVMIFAIAFIAAPVAHAADVVTPVITPTPVTPWYASSTLWVSLLAVGTSIFGIWAGAGKSDATAQLTTAQKINKTLVVGIEAATSIPEVAAFEKTIKGKITEFAKNAGVEPLLNEIVKDLT